MGNSEYRIAIIIIIMVLTQGSVTKEGKLRKALFRIVAADYKPTHFTLDWWNI